MAQITLKGNPVQTSGELPTKGSASPSFSLVAQDLSEKDLAGLGAKATVLNIFPSIDTPTCAMSVRSFNEKAAAVDGVVIANVSADLPFAQKRFCGAEGIENAITLSTFRSSFADDFGLRITDGPLAGLCARAVVVLDGSGQVTYTELVGEIADEPNYDAALEAASSAAG